MIYELTYKMYSFNSRDLLLLSFYVIAVQSSQSAHNIPIQSLSDGFILDCPPPPVEMPIKPVLYWKDFTELPVPEDAISSGVQTAAGGKPRKVFLAQASFPIDGSGLQPTALFNDSSSVLNSYKRTISTNKHIKVLCSNMPPEKSHRFLKWVPSQTTKTHPDSHLVIAGYETSPETDYNLFFGRAYDGFLFVTGKAVRRTNQQGFQLYYPWQEGERSLYDDIEILVYSKYF